MKVDSKVRTTCKAWAEAELDRYVDAHALDSDPEKLVDLQVAYGLYNKYLETVPIYNPNNVISFLSKLILRQPLTPIVVREESFDSDWTEIDHDDEGTKYYVSNRMPSLIVRITKSETTYIDMDRVICHDLGGETPMSTYVDDDITSFISAKIPIKFPYMGDHKIHVATVKSVNDDGSKVIFIKSARDSLSGVIYDINVYLARSASGEVAIVPVDEFANFVKGGNK